MKGKKAISLLVILIVFIFADLFASYFYRTCIQRSYQKSKVISELGIMYKPNLNILSKWGNREYSLVTNSLGFRDRKARNIPLESSEYRIVLMGDSFVDGVGYDYNHSFAGILDNLIQDAKITLLNAGVIDNSPRNYYYKTNYLLNTIQLKFDCMICFIDMSDIINEACAEIKNIDDSVKKNIKLPANPHHASFIEWIRNHSLIIELIYQVKYMVSPRLPIGISGVRWTVDEKQWKSYGEYGMGIAQQWMSLLSDMLKRYGIKMVIVIYPWPDQILDHDINSKQVRMWQDWADKKDVIMVNLFPVFMKDNDAIKTINEYFIPGDVHWNYKGHQVVARELYAVTVDGVSIN